MDAIWSLWRVACRESAGGPRSDECCDGLRRGRAAATVLSAANRFLCITNKLPSNDPPSNDFRLITDVPIRNALEACDNAAAFDVPLQEQLMIISVLAPSPVSEVIPSLLPVRLRASIKEGRSVGSSEAGRSARPVLRTHDR